VLFCITPPSFWSAPRTVASTQRAVPSAGRREPRRLG